jgi:hypothetical protein
MRYYTGVGSRETPEEILVLMEKVAYKFAKEGYILRSGGAGGADTAFWNGASQTETPIEIFLPWNGFSGLYHDEARGYYAPTKDETYARAEEITSEIHPAWGRLTRGPRALHARNVYQVLGQDLQTPSDFLICYSKPSGNSISGGTRTAWEVAKKFGVRCFNLYDEENVRRVQFYLDGGGNGTD